MRHRQRPSRGPDSGRRGPSYRGPLGVRAGAGAFGAGRGHLVSSAKGF